MTDEILTRQVSFAATEVREENDGLTLEGYAAMFNSPTEINSAEGRFIETIAPGAFKRTVDRKGARGIKLQFNHGQHSQIGDFPIGVIRDIREDERGLFISARLHQNWMVEPVREAISTGAIDGMSFRFRPILQDWQEDEETGERLRVLREVELYEVGPVVWPAYPATSVSVRAREIVSSLMDPEQRAEIARALLFGTSEELAEPGPSEEPATDDEPAERPFVDRSADVQSLRESIARFIKNESETV